MSYVTVNGIRTYYEQAGNKSNQALVLIHGASQDTLSWRYVIDKLADHFNVIAVDLPGHGKSDLINGAAFERTTDNANHVLELSKQLKLGAPVFMGHSMGGGIACHIAALAPESVTGLVLVNGLSYKAAVTTGYSNNTIMDLIQVNCNDWFEVNFTELIGTKTDRLRAKEIVREARRCIPEVAISDIRAYASYDLNSDIDKIKCPVVIVETDEDWSVPLEPAVEARKLLKSASDLIVLAGYGHFPQSENPDLFIAELRNSLMRLGLLE